jgi:hypothetical protein
MRKKKILEIERMILFVELALDEAMDLSADRLLGDDNCNL